jgi:hypothetical protein
MWYASRRDIIAGTSERNLTDTRQRLDSICNSLVKWFAAAFASDFHTTSHTQLPHPEAQVESCGD